MYKLLILYSALLVSWYYPPLSFADDASTGGQIYSTLRKLDFKQVGLRVSTQDQFADPLYRRALARLRKSGLEPVAPKYNGTVQAMLVLTLNPIPVKDGSANKILYVKKVELLEDVTIKRDSELHLEGVTWSFGPGHPQILSSITLETLLEDVDLLIDQFIVSYGLPRPK